VEEGLRNDPPASPVTGACYIIGNSPTGEWVGKSRRIAGYTGGGWRYIAPAEGMSAYVRATGTTANYRAGAWEIGTMRGATLVLGGLQVVTGRLAAIPGPSGGTNVDVECRSAINQVLAALRQHGLIES
jgi:hypothetical protein